VTGFYRNINLHAFLRKLARSQQSVLLLDYDGTLAPFRVERNQAWPYPGVTELLNEIVETRRTRVAFISGRPARELLPLLKLARQPEIYGAYGLEHLHTDGQYESRPIDASAREALRRANEWTRRLNLQRHVEHKPGCVAVHWRGLSEEAAEAIRQEVRTAWVPIAEQAKLSLEDFDGGIELRAPLCNKLNAVRSVLEEVEAVDEDVPVAYLGDDSSDEQVFRATQGRCLRVLVREKWRETQADLWLRPPLQLMEFFRDWLQACLSQQMEHGIAIVATTEEEEGSHRIA
jgi:trehalose-phosphatase